MTPEQQKLWEELYRQWRGFEPPMPREEVERRLLEMLIAGKDDDFAVVKNLHVVIKNGRAAWFFKLTPKAASAPLHAIAISKRTKPKERPIKKKLGNYSEVRTCLTTRTITYDIAVMLVERLRDFLENAREDMPDIDERKMFRVWSRGSQSDVSSLNFREQQYLNRLLNIASWLPAPASGLTEDDDIDDLNFYNEVETSDENVPPVQPDEVEDYKIIEGREINRSHFTDWEPSQSARAAGDVDL
jgi:hypothetical protein